MIDFSDCGHGANIIRNCEFHDSAYSRDWKIADSILKAIATDLRQRILAEVEAQIRQEAPKLLPILHLVLKNGRKGRSSSLRSLRAKYHLRHHGAEAKYFRALTTLTTIIQRKIYDPSAYRISPNNDKGEIDFLH